MLLPELRSEDDLGVGADSSASVDSTRANRLGSNRQQADGERKFAAMPRIRVQRRRATDSRAAISARVSGRSQTEEDGTCIIEHSSEMDRN